MPIDNLENKSDADVKALFDYVKEQIKQMEDDGEFDEDDEYFEPWTDAYSELDLEIQRRLGFDITPKGLKINKDGNQYNA